jgi:predicted enzyme related to lactoylglutathione lyase
VQVESADNTAARATKLGGSIVVPATDIPTVGRFAVIVDPLGARLGVIKPEPM